MSRLFVIEAPGKCRTLVALLEGVDFPARIQATVGHIFQMPEKLSEIGIDSAYRDFARKPRNLAVVERLRQEVNLAEGNVFVATDADQEGDVIAWDVAELVKDICPNPMRVRLKGMDKDSILQSIAEATPVRKLDAVGGRTRALVDRLIGAGFSKDGVAVGRVSTALLGLVAGQKPSTLRLTLSAPAEDGGRPWFAVADLAAPITPEVAQKLVELRLPPLRIGLHGGKPVVRDVVTKPAHMGDIMVRCGDRLQLSPTETADSLQRIYEMGKNSYPRAGSRGITMAVARKMVEMLKKQGYNTDADLYAGKEATEAHDAPYPIGAVDLKSDPRKLGHDDGVRAVLARDFVKAGQAHTEQVPSATVLVPFLLNRGFEQSVADAVARMPWRREVGPRYPGQESFPVSNIEVRRADVVLLERAVAAGLGRPSTWARHVETFMSRGLMDEDMNLTAKGKHWVEKSPVELLDPRVSAAIERACERVTDAMMTHADREPWEINAERIVRALPPAIKGVVEGLVVNEPPHAKIDPIEEYGLADSATMEAEASAALPTYQPRPMDY